MINANRYKDDIIYILKHCNETHNLEQLFEELSCYIKDMAKWLILKYILIFKDEFSSFTVDTMYKLNNIGAFKNVENLKKGN